MIGGMPQKHRIKRIQRIQPHAPELSASESSRCPLCGRQLVAGPSVDAHHLVPSSQGGTEKFLIHRVCHQKIHATFSEHELGSALNSWHALREHSAMESFLKWVAKKSPTFIDRTKKANRLRR
jgi:hypothetical protein